MTYREISVALRHIGIRTNNEFARNAALHGIKLPTKSAVPTNDSFTDEERAAADRLVQKRFQGRNALKG